MSAKAIDIETCYVVTHHLETNIIVTFLQTFKEHVLFLDAELDDACPLVDSFYSLLGMHNSISEKMKDCKRPKIIGRDCTKLRDILLEPNMDENKKWKMFQNVGDEIISGRFDLSLYDKCPLLLFYKKNKIDINEDVYLRQLTVLLFNFWAIYEEASSYETNEDNMQRMEELCAFWRKESCDILPQTYYVHVVGSVLPRMARRLYDNHGYGYGVMSMQSGEHCNKMAKTLYKHCTNEWHDRANYDAYSHVMHMNWLRYIEFKPAKTKGVQATILKRELGF